MYVGVDVGGTKCAVVLGDENGNVMNKIKFKTTDVSSTLNNIFNSIERFKGFKSIGVSCGGPLDTRAGVILSPPNLPGWDNIRIVDLLKNKYKVPVSLQNDANACALAEWRFGAGKGTKNMVFLTFGTGLGAGLILDGRLYSGTNGMAGEVGHIRLENYGPVGYGKAGSFEGFCSGNGIAQIGKMIAMEHFQQGKTVSYCSSYDQLDEISAKLIADCADNGDEIAKEVYRICAEKLGYGLAILIDILNPEVIVMGSIFARSHNLLWDVTEKVIKREALSHSYNVCKVVPAALGEQIGDYAAIAVAIDALR